MKDLLSPWTVQDVEEDTNQQLLSQFLGERDGYVQVGPQKYLFPKRFEQDGPSLYEFQPRPDDTWVVTFPRSGTTLTQELVWLLSNNLDYNTAARIPLTQRFPFLEFSACVNKELLSELVSEASDDSAREELISATDSVLPWLENTSQPRFIKTHLPLSLLHPDLLTCGAKVIYVARNPKDVAVSYFHLHQLFKTLDFVGTFEQFWCHFESNRLQWCPYWSHVNEAWQLRHSGNMLFLFYEEIQQNMQKIIQRIGSFLDFDVAADEAVNLARHLDITNFRNNSSVNFDILRRLGVLNNTAQGFIRRGGKSGPAQTDFSPYLARRADQWIENNLNGTTLRFPEPQS